MGFKKFDNSLKPLFKMVSLNTIKDDIMKIYAIEKEKISSDLKNVENKITITTNMWTSNPKKCYMAITFQYINETWL